MAAEREKERDEATKEVKRQKTRRGERDEQRPYPAMHLAETGSCIHCVLDNLLCECRCMHVHRVNGLYSCN